VNEIVIQVENLSKIYRIGAPQAQYKTLREALIGAFKRPISWLRNSPLVSPNSETLWALRNVSLEINRGEVVGIIGRNGAGKTTLLRILSRVTEPTEGRAIIRGRVGSLLEVGTGFHPELTGQENIYLNGAILGMKRYEIARKFDEIVAFAEVEKFINTPVKHFSSGMYLRLAFAVAAHLEPEILLVDEVLAVGDAAFQKKCLGKMEDVAQEGRTVLFVSHNMAAVEGLCSRVICLDAGYLIEDGQPGEVVSSYLNTSLSSLTEHVWDDVAGAPGNEKVRLCRASIRPENGSPSDPITVKTPFSMEFDYWNLKPGVCLNLSLHLINEQEITVFNTGPVREPRWHGRPFPKGLFRSVCRVSGDFLNDGTYRVLLLVIENQSAVIFRYDNVLIFHIQDAPDLRGAWYGKWPGVVRPILEWTTELLGEVHSHES
jgi:lipopolysaccharide transport system ATP-binding protein